MTRPSPENYLTIRLRNGIQQTPQRASFEEEPFANCTGVVILLQLARSVLPNPFAQSHQGQSSSAFYRPDLDGLRAVAVLSVLIYHIDAAVSPGGFTGVDIFFVLSGFLITRILVTDLDGGNFSLVSFYQRRMRRLLPALFVMLGATAAIAFALLTPSQLEAFGKHMFAATFSLSNITLWQDVGYFSPAAASNPLLHTWSLAVEEQFYLVYPILLMVIFRRYRHLATLIIFGCAAFSFCLSVWQVNLSQSAAQQSAGYFLPFSRFWELALGGLLALRIVRSPRTSMEAFLARIVGLLLIAAALVVASPDAFPGYAALLPCVGTALLIWAGQNEDVQRHRDDLALTVLSSKPFVLVGLLSYSLYLWHWPIIVFARQIQVWNEQTWIVWSLVPLMFLIAYLSWRFVEQPLRRAPATPVVRGPFSRHRVFGASAAFCTVLGAVGLSFSFSGGAPGRLPSNTIEALAAERDFSPLRRACHSAVDGTDTFEDRCRFGPETAPRVVVYSDSHGAELSFALSEHAYDVPMRLTQITASACPPVAYWNEVDPLCREFNNTMLDGLRAKDPALVLMTAFWMSQHSTSDAFWHGIDNKIEKIKAAGHTVVLLGPPPRAPRSLPDAAALALRYKGIEPQSLKIPVDWDRLNAVEARIQALAEKHAVAFLPLSETFCNGDYCPATRKGDLILFDAHHLSMSASRYVVDNAILPKIASVLDSHDAFGTEYSQGTPEYQ